MGTIKRGTYGYSTGEGWGVWRMRRNTAGSVLVEFICPECGTSISLSSHVIEVDGQAWPPVLCPSKRCGFHCRVRLAAYWAIFHSPIFHTEIPAERVQEKWVTKFKKELTGLAKS